MGELIKESLKSISDMTRQEKVVFTPLVAMTLLLGVYPAVALDLIGPSVDALVSNFETATSGAGLSNQIAVSN